MPELIEAISKWIDESHACCLCGKQYMGWGNNPEPIKGYPGRCCNECNNDLVIPWRIRYGRNTEPLWLRFGLGKTRSERVECAHPFHDGPVDEYLSRYPAKDINVGYLPVGKREPTQLHEIVGKDGGRVDNSDQLGQAIESVLGVTLRRLND